MERGRVAEKKRRERIDKGREIDGWMDGWMDELMDGSEFREG